MKKFRVGVLKEYTILASVEYEVEAENELEIEKAIEMGGVEYNFTPISRTSSLDKFEGLTASANHYETLDYIEEFKEEAV